MEKRRNQCWSGRKIITSANKKGGVSKTTTTVHLAHYGVDFLGLRVVLVDLDVQGPKSDRGNASSCFPGQPVILDASQLFEPCPENWRYEWEGEPEVRVIQANKRLVYAESYTGDVVDGTPLGIEVLQRPREWLSRIDCDLIIIDTPPSSEVRLRAALVASDSVLTPFTMESFSMDGMQALYEEIHEVRAAFNPGLRLLGILPTKLNPRSRKQRELYEAMVAQMPDMVIPAPTKDRAPVPEAIAEHRPVWRRVSGSSVRAAADEMKASCKAIFERVKQ